MDVSDLIDGLNDPQREAVTLPIDGENPGGALVLAGAGSGKTRVLVHRIAWLVRVEGAHPWNILAVTFTNKAAREMRHRIESLLAEEGERHRLGGMWMGTFHGLAHRLLRAHFQEARLPKEFQILDADDQLRLIKRVLKALDLDEARWPPKQAMWFINQQKDEGIRPHQIDPGHDRFLRQMIEIYKEYQAACERGGQVDFAELLLRAHEMLRDNSELLGHYQERFPFILVDEFQDTNAIQYAWLRLLSGPQSRIFAVGDDDQSIYGWRGARVENIQQFRTHYPHAPLIRLEQNYRSTSAILDAANALIANNPSRLGKNLWTDRGEGEPIQLYAAFNDLDEARYVADLVQGFIERGEPATHLAILYRSNAQSRVFEEALIQRAIPYRVYGGLRFFERAEIKDALSYLRLVSHPDDDGAFERAVNQPPRGIGPRTLELVRGQARDANGSLWQGAQRILADKALPARAANALGAFLNLIEGLRTTSDGLELGEIVEQATNASGLLEHFKNSKDEKSQDRVENLEELINASREFQYQAQDEEDLGDLQAFLAHAALESGERQGDPSQPCVQLMTLHSAKGLEFPYVFIGGLEEELFPHQMSMDDPARLEEERRLCYVGMTRAMRKLHLSYAEERRIHGQSRFAHPSRFLREIPAALVEEVRPRAHVSQPRYSGTSSGFGYTPPPPAIEGFRLGERVRHPKFGTGVILDAKGQGSRAEVQINFEGAGKKWLVLAYANLQPA